MYILEFTKTIDQNGNIIPITEETKYKRYNNIIYDDYNDAFEDRYIYMKYTYDSYIRISEI